MVELIELFFLAVVLHAVQFGVRLTVAADDGAGQEGYTRYEQQLQQSSPGEDVIQRGDLRQDGSRPHADEVVRDQTWGRIYQLFNVTMMLFV